MEHVLLLCDTVDDAVGRLGVMLDAFVCNYCLYQHKMSGDLTKVKESVVTIRSRCSRVMPYLINNNYMLKSGSIVKWNTFCCSAILSMMQWAVLV